MQKLFHPHPDFQKKAHIKNMEEYEKLWDEARQNPEKYWDNLAKNNLSWIKKYTKVLDSSKAPFYSWFIGGKLNIADQCIDRHLKEKSEKTAIIWESEAGESRNITYSELQKSVNRLANVLKQDFKIKKGDRVVIYMPMIPEAVFAMLACMRIGAVHVVVFGGFSSEVLRERILDTKAKLVITADGAYRHGKPYLLKPIVDEALEKDELKHNLNVLVIQHNKQKISFKKGRDYDYASLIKKKSTKIESEVMDSEDLSFILHTSGSTGKPKGIKHSTAGYILWAWYTTKVVFDIKEDSIFWCTADIGWITGHTYGVYGPLANGITIVMYEGVPTFPDNGRWWQIIEKHKITQFYTAPTAIRSLKRLGPKEPLKYDLSSLRVLGTVGEPIDPEAWMWYYENVGKSRCPIVDTWWQTETGGHIIAPLPGATPIKPGSATKPLPGIHAEILDIDGNRVSNGSSGYLCITKPWPSMLRSIWGDDERYVNSYFKEIKSSENNHVYFSGDGAYYDDNGYIIITGRTDDVMNVSGHRLSSAEIESALTAHKYVTEAAVVSKINEITGESIVAYITTSLDYEPSINIHEELNLIVRKKIGPIVKIDQLIIVPGLPKTRSGKVLRRILRSIARGEQPTQDLSTIENSDIVFKIQNMYQNRRFYYKTVKNISNTINVASD